MVTYENVKLELSGQVAILSIDRPGALNALNSQTLGEIEQVVEAVAVDRNLRALVVTGAGHKAFVAGADIAEMVALEADQGRKFSQLGHRVFARLESLAIPTVAALNGFALGGGLELALACDLLYASETAKLGFPEVGLGVIPGFGGTVRLTRLVGRARAMELVFTGQRVDARQAKEMGLVLEVLPQERLLPHCLEVAQKIAANGPLAVAQAKRVMTLGADPQLLAACAFEQQAFGLLFGTSDQKEGMAAFVEKRKPHFTGA